MKKIIIGMGNEGFKLVLNGHFLQEASKEYACVGEENNASNGIFGEQDGMAFCRSC